MAAPLKIGLNIDWLKPELRVEVAQVAEQLGFDSIWAGEHVGLSKYPEAWRAYPSVMAKGADGTEADANFLPDSNFLDPFITLAVIASATKTVRLGVGVHLLALRDALLAARTVASLDVLSGGRLDLAVGLGWNEAEYRFAGAQWSHRGKKLDETIRAMRVLFEDETPEFHGEFFDFGPLGFQPKPIQKPFPFIIGGGTPPAERRAGKLGNGWYGRIESIPAIRQHLAEAGRSDEPFSFSAVTFGLVSVAELEAMVEKGVRSAVVTPWPGRKVGEVGREGIAALESYARSIGLG
jgi:probable F420-dependent oxidoreductase